MALIMGWICSGVALGGSSIFGRGAAGALCWGFVALPLLIAGITVGGIGGGDIKLTGACGLVLGFERTLAGLLMALMFLLLFHWAGQCIRKCKKINCGVGKEQAYPLVPFLLLGMLMSVRIGG